MSGFQNLTPDSITLTPGVPQQEALYRADKDTTVQYTGEPLSDYGKRLVEMALARYPQLDALSAELFVRGWMAGLLDEEGQLKEAPPAPPAKTPDQ